MTKKLKKQNAPTTSSEHKTIHVQVLGGNQDDISILGKAMKKFEKTLPFKLHAIITNESVSLHSVDYLLKGLLEMRKEMKENDRRKMPSMRKK